MTTHISLFLTLREVTVKVTPSVSINAVKLFFVNTHVKRVLVDHKHAHVLGQQFAGMSCKEENREGEIKRPYRYAFCLNSLGVKRLEMRSESGSEHT